MALSEPTTVDWIGDVAIYEWINQDKFLIKFPIAKREKIINIVIAWVEKVYKERKWGSLPKDKKEALQNGKDIKINDTIKKVAVEKEYCIIETDLGQKTFLNKFLKDEIKKMQREEK